LFRSGSSDDLFRVLADSLDDAIVAISGDGTRLLSSNHAFAVQTGYTRSELETLSIQALFPGESGERATGRIFSPWDSADCQLTDVPLRTRQGTILLMDISGHATGPAGSPILLLCRPASQRVRREETARARRTRAQTLVALSSLLLDPSERSLPATLELCRPLVSATYLGLYRVSASSPDFILEGPMPDAFPSRLPASAIDGLRPATAWSMGHRTEHALQKSARACGISSLLTAPLGSSAACVGVLVAGWRDHADMPEDAERWMAFGANLCHAMLLWDAQQKRITFQTRSIAQLRFEIDALFAVSPDGLLTLDDELRVVAVNHAAGRMLGYQEAELTGMSIQDVLVGPLDVRGTLLDAAGHKRPAEQPRITIHRRDGTPFPVHLRARPLADQGDAKLLLSLQDRSQQEAIEDQTEMLHQRALLGDVTAIFAHEVRNPINNISTGIQLVSSRLGTDHPQRQALDRVRSECDRLNQLLTDVLFFARPLELKMEAIDLAEMMKRLVARWSPRFSQAGIHCHTNFDSGTPKASADPRTLEQVILNLITNALQAMKDGGTISISLSSAKSTRIPMVELRIADTGPGIPSDMIDRIFDPFFTTKKEGTGLGLAISRRILLAHKGTIDVESFPDAGTVFTLRVPAANQSIG